MVRRGKELEGFHTSAHTFLTLIKVTIVVRCYDGKILSIHMFVDIRRCQTILRETVPGFQPPYSRTEENPSSFALQPAIHLVVKRKWLPNQVLPNHAAGFVMVTS